LSSFAANLRTFTFIGPALAIVTAIPARADNIVVTMRGAGQVTPLFLSDGSGDQGVCNQKNAPASTCSYGVESFSNFTAKQTASGFKTDFSTGQTDFTQAKSITGAYSGQIARVATNQYSGAQGLIAYPVVTGTNSFTLTLTPHGLAGANYFGLLITAMGATNLLRLHMQDGSVMDFTLSSLKTLISNTSSPGAYNGNPTANLYGQRMGEPYAFVNFYDTNGYISSVEFSNSSSSGFESSNHAVGFFDKPTIQGNVMLTQQSVSVPEPSSILMVLAGLAGVQAWRRRGRPSPATPPH